MAIFNNSDREDIENCIDLIHEEFKRPIVIYKDMKLKSVTVDFSYSNIYKRNNQGKRTAEREVQKIDSFARIMHGQPRADIWSDPSIKSQIKIKIPSNTARLRVDKETYKILLEAKRVVITEEDRRYKLSSDFKPHGVFNNRYYDFFIQVIDEED